MCFDAAGNKSDWTSSGERWITINKLNIRVQPRSSIYRRLMVMLDQFSCDAAGMDVFRMCRDRFNLIPQAFEAPCPASLQIISSSISDCWVSSAWRLQTRCLVIKAPKYRYILHETWTIEVGTGLFIFQQDTDTNSSNVHEWPLFEPGQISLESPDRVWEDLQSKL